MLSFIKTFGYSFRAAPLTEVGGSLENPGRGWYRIYTYRVGREDPQEPVRYEGEWLALVLIDIGAYRDGDLDEAALCQIDRILQSFVRIKMNMIVRVCYDVEGKGMVREPSLFSQVKKHFEQVLRVLVTYAEHVYVYQGLLVGSWGEMHESKFLSPKCLKELIGLFEAETEGRIALAIRKPVQYRMVFPEGADPGKIGFFNDGMLGSETHLGTFAPEAAGRGSWQEPWSPEEEIQFMESLLDGVPYGGEVVSASEQLSAQQVVEELRRFRVSYLNSTHEERLLSHWKIQPYQDGSLYDYVGAHLGYRFLVKAVNVKLGKRLEISLEVLNDGFGEIYEEAEVTVYALTSVGGVMKRLGCLEGSFLRLKNGQARTLKGSFDVQALMADGKVGSHRLYVDLRRKRDGEAITFAQKYEEAGLFLGEFYRGR